MKKLILSSVISFIFALCCVGAGAIISNFASAEVEQELASQETVNEAGAKLLYDQEKQYFYLEDGLYPQEYAGAQSDITAEECGFDFLINDTLHPVYTSGNDYYILVTAPKTQTIKLSSGNVSFVAGEAYWFKFTPIRWRVSDYGTSHSQISRYYSFQDMTVVSDMVLGYGAIQTRLVSEGWSYAESSMHLSNLANFEASDLFKPQAIVEYSCSIDTYSPVGAIQKVTTSTQTYNKYIQASVADIKENLGDSRSTASDLVCMLMGCSSDAYVDYSTRDLVSLNNGKKVTSAGMATSVWLDYQNGTRLSAHLKMKSLTTQLSSGQSFSNILKGLERGNNTGYSVQDTKIQKIVFDYYTSPNSYMVGGVNVIDGLSGADVSAAQDNSVLAYGIGSNTVYVLSEMKVYTNTNANHYFSYFSSLTNVQFNNFDTSNATTMIRCFYNCASLANLDVSSFDTSKVTSMSTMFGGCKALLELDLSNFNTSRVTTFESLFSNCSKLANLNISNFNTANVTNFAGMFQNCTALRNADFSHFNTEKATSMYVMFAGSGFETLDLSSFNTPRLSVFYQMFDGCSRLTSLNISNFNTSRVGDMRLLFRNCSNLTELDVSNFNTSGVSLMSYMFYNCRSLTSLDVSNFNTSRVQSMAQMFNTCQKLQSLDLSNWNTANVTEMNGMFSYCYALTELDLSSFNTSKVRTMNSMFAATRFTTLDLSNFDTSNVTDMESMFSNSINLTSVNISSFNTSKVTNFHYWFLSCSKLTSLDVSHIDTSSATNMESMFYGCQLLPVLDVSHWNTSKVTNMGQVFYNCRGLTSLDLSNWDTSNVTMMTHLFRFCVSLRTIYASELWNTAKVTSSIGMFESDSALVGGNGTTYSGSHIGKDYARIDRIGQPGYFTDVRAMSSLVNGQAFNTAVLSLGDFSEVSDKKIVFDFYTSENTYMVGDVNVIAGGVDSTLTSADVSRLQNGSVMAYYNPNVRPGEVYILADRTIYANTNASYMFSELSGWDIYFNNFDTSIATNMSYMFYRFAGNLYGVENQSALSNFDTSGVTNMSYMFCESTFTSLDLSAFDTSNVTDMKFMFQASENLASLNVSSFNTSRVTSMHSMFSACGALTSVDISNFDTSNVTSMGFMFAGSGFESLDLSNFNTPRLASMSNMFQDCTALATLDLSSFSTANVTNMNSVFNGCGALTTLDLTSLNTAKVKSMISMFAGCTGLQTIYVSDLFTTDLVTDSTSMFHNCSTLVGGNGTAWASGNVDKTYAKIDKDGEPGYFSCFVMISGRDFNKILKGDAYTAVNTSIKKIVFDYYTSAGSYIINDINVIENLSGEDVSVAANGSVQVYRVGTDIYVLSSSKIYTNPSAWSMFQGLEGLESIVFNNFDTSYSEEMYWMFNGCSSLTSLDLSSFDTSKLTDMYAMFMDCFSLTSLDLSSFETSKVTSMVMTFQNCSSLTSLNLSSFDTSNVTSMTSMFSGCTALTNLNLSSFNTANVTDMSNMFQNCSSLASLDLSKFNTEKVTNMAGMFKNCAALATLDLSKFITTNVTNMYNMFYGCSGLTSLDLSKFNTAKVTSMDGMFQNCAALATLDLSKFITTNVTNMQNMFYGCSGLASLDLSKFNTAKVTNMNQMFAGCTALSSLNLSSFNTAAVTDMGFMFTDCKAIESLDIASFNTSSVTNMSSMFSNCVTLQTVFVSDLWTVANVANDENMFYECSLLVGGNGTTFDSATLDKTYAKIDAVGAPGYFTLKTASTSEGEQDVLEEESFDTKLIWFGAIWVVVAICVAMAVVIFRKKKRA